MQILRTALWVLIAVIVCSFVWMNWHMAEVNLWPLEAGFLHVDWPIGIIALVFFLLGLLPTWALSKATRWGLKRRIANLENTVKAMTPTPPLATSTQLEAASGPATASSSAASSFTD